MHMKLVAVWGQSALWYRMAWYSKALMIAAIDSIRCFCQNPNLVKVDYPGSIH